jgi:hypothetical protein
VVFALVAFVLWRYWKPISTALANFWRDLRALLDRLLGREPREAAAADAQEPVAAAPPRPFSAFEDPYASGAAQRWPPGALIRYSYEAFEAWAREQGCGQVGEQTPLEFARSVANAAPHVAAEARALADLYGEAAYAADGRVLGSLAPLERLWRLMQQRQPAATA